MAGDDLLDDRAVFALGRFVDEVVVVEGFIDGAIATYVSSDIPDEWNLDGLRGYLYGVLCGEDDFRYSQEELNRINAEDIRRMLLERADALYKKQEELFTPEVFREVERIVLLGGVPGHIAEWRDLSGEAGKCAND